jgi:hypothetical protein
MTMNVPADLFDADMDGVADRLRNAIGFSETVRSAERGFRQLVELRPAG